jgi:phosphoenolpyruvate synthase/pyruvate phosphate dikinase
VSTVTEKIVRQKWLARWAGSYTFTSASYWAPQYYHSLNKYLGISFEHTLFIHKKGVVSFYIPERELKRLGNYLAKQCGKSGYAKKYCVALKANTDKLMPIMKGMQKSIPTKQEYLKFLTYFDKHLAYHNFVKKTVDFLSPELLTKLLPLFKDARLYSEVVYSESERMFRALAKKIAERENHKAVLLTCLTQKDLENYIFSGTLPNRKDLQARFNHSILYSEKGKLSVLTGREAQQIEKIILKGVSSTDKKLTGVIAYGGKVSGYARIVPDPHDVKKFNKGDILITGMTRPEFLPVINKAGAIVTDIGGVLSHAAITARELKIPTLVGTGNASRTFRDGDWIEVNADIGMVQLIKK